jgi:hypothetical protein
MTAAPEEFDGDLGLNLVFESAPKPLTPDGSAPTKKRKNKYDRRREKGRLAKLAKVGPSSRDSVVASGGDVSKSEPSFASSHSCVLSNAPLLNDDMLAVVARGPPDVPLQTSQSSVPAASFSTVTSKHDSARSQAASSTTNKQANERAKKHMVQLVPTATQMTSSRRNRVSFSR